MNEELAECARLNFDNFEKAFPFALSHPYYVIAKSQLNEALGFMSIEQSIEMMDKIKKDKNN